MRIVSLPYRFVVGLFALMILLGGLMLSQAQAAIYSGKVIAVSSEDRTLKIVSTGGRSKQFRLSTSTKITIQRKSGKLEEISKGDQVTIYTTKSGKVTRLKKVDASKTPRKKPKRKPKTKPAEEAAADNPWTGFRGKNRSNKSSETGLQSEWDDDGPELLWTATGLGEGYSSVSISNGVLYTMGNVDGKEQIHAINMENGQIEWSVISSTKVYKNGQGNGPRGTPTIDGDKLYALGGNGDLTCVDLNKHEKVWSRNILKDFEGTNIQWGISESVLIDGDKLICTPGGRLATMVALNKNNGEVIWTSRIEGNPKASYSSPILIDVGGVRQYVTFVSNAVVGVRAKDGLPLWGNKKPSNGTANCSAPVYEAGLLFSASGYGTGGTLLALSSRAKKTRAEFKYHTKNMKNHHGGMVILDGYLYGSSDPGILTCLELKTGNVKWKSRSPGKGSLVLADGHLYCRDEKGPITLVEATPEEYREKGKFDQPNRSNRRAWAHPVVADGKLFIRDMDKLLVFDVQKK